jgi:hypothetical protein
MHCEGYLQPLKRTVGLLRFWLGQCIKVTSQDAELPQLQVLQLSVLRFSKEYLREIDVTDNGSEI